MFVDAGNRNGCSSGFSSGLLLMCSIRKSLFGATVACAFPGLNSFHSYLRISPLGVSCNSELCTDFSPSSVLNWEVITLPPEFCWTENVSVATRCPFMNTPSVPESTICPSLALLSLSPATAITGRSSKTAPVRAIAPNFTLRLLACGPLLQAQAGCDFLRDVADFLSGGVDMNLRSQIERAPRLIQLPEYLLVPSQWPLRRIIAAALPQFVD